MNDILSSKEICLANAETRFLTPRRQRFSIPYNFMGYLMKEWTPRVYEKVIKTCKYFFSAHRLVPISQHEKYFSIEEFLLKCLEKNFKIWIFEWLWCGSSISTLLREVYRWSIDDIHIHHHRLTFAEYQLVISIPTLKIISLEEVRVTDDGDINNIYPVDALVKPLKYLKNFDTTAFLFDNEAAKRLTNTFIPNKLKNLCLQRIPVLIDFEHLYRLGMNTSLTEIHVTFRFRDIGNAFYDDAQNHNPIQLKCVDGQAFSYYEFIFENFKITAIFSNN